MELIKVTLLIITSFFSMLFSNVLNLIIILSGDGTAIGSDKVEDWANITWKKFKNNCKRFYEICKGK